jgi:hypothetical protein
VKNLNIKVNNLGWRHGSSGRAPAKQEQSPELKPQYCQNNNNNNSFPINDRKGSKKEQAHLQN